jgi:glutamate synthase (NADPH/NADH) small chain
VRPGDRSHGGVPPPRRRSRRGPTLRDPASRVGGQPVAIEAIEKAIVERAFAAGWIAAARAEANPWPTWPLVFRTSSSQEEGGERTFAFRTTHLEGEAGRLVARHGERADAPGPGIRIPVDALILALGFTGPDTSTLVGELGVALDARGNLAIDAGYATSVPGVYCAGDAHRGASLIVWAIAEGRELARSVDAALRGERSCLPARGQDLPF